MMASVVMFTGCASQEIQDRKAASEAAAIAAAQPTATPAPTPAPTPEPINAWSLLDNLPEFAVGTLDKPDMTWTDGLPLGVSPLTYEDGSFVSGLYSSASGSSTTNQERVREGFERDADFRIPEIVRSGNGGNGHRQY